VPVSGHCEAVEEEKHMNARTCIFILTIALVSATPLSAATTPTGSATTAQSLGFTDHFVVANGVRLHYVTAGKGDPVLLIPGWPESWYTWRFVMKQLAAAGREAYALDPRGFGDSEAPSGGYDLATSAQDVHAFIAAVGLARPGGIDIVSHDVGTWIAFAHAYVYPKDVHRLVLSEAVIPGTTAPPPAGIPSDAQIIHTWQFTFNRIPNLPETLVTGHERAYLAFIFNTKAYKTSVFDTAALDEYTRVFLLPGVLRASFEYYRQAFGAAGLQQMQAWTAQKLAMPVFAIGGQNGLGENMLKSIQPFATRVSGMVLPACGHFVAEECPSEFTGAVLGFWQQTPAE
jgi:pimeloyl-ACP methyl ester carboxylesterase